MNNFLSTMLGRASLLLPFLCVIFYQLPAQSSCNFTVAPEYACVGGNSVYEISVQSPVNYYIVWDNIPIGLKVNSDNGMLTVHWDAPGTAEIVARIFSVANPGIPLGYCSVSTQVSAGFTPEIVPEYLPEGNCTLIEEGKARFITGYCGGGTVRFFPNGSGGTYTWTVSGNSTGHSVDDDDVLTVELGSSGQVEICLTESGEDGCGVPVCEKYDIYAPPVTSFTEITYNTANPINICRGEDLIFLGTFSDPNDLPVGTWVWEIRDAATNNLVGFGSDPNLEHTFNVPGTYTVTMYATNCLGCSSEPTSVTVNVSEAIVPEILCPSVVCQSATPVKYCTTADCTSFTWSQSGGTQNGPNDESCYEVIWDMPQDNGYGIVWLTVANCNGNLCPTPVAVEVPVIPTVQVVTGPENLCDPNAIDQVYSVPYWPGAVYNWQINITSNLSGGSVYIAPSGNHAVVGLNNFYGTFCVKVNITHPVAGCVSGGQKCVEVRNMSLSGDSFCYGEDVVLAITPAPTPTPYKVTWVVMETNSPPQVVFDAPGTTLPFSYFGAPGNYTVKATVMFNGLQMFECDELVATVVIQEPVTIEDVAGPTLVCPGKAYKYTAVPGTGNFEWTVTGGTPATASGLNLSTLNITWTPGVPHAISVVRTVNGCASAPFEVTVEEIELEDIVISTDDPACPDGSLATYTVNIPDAEVYNWSIQPSFAGSIISGQNSPQITVQWYTSAPSNPKIKLIIRICGVNHTVELPVPISPPFLNINCPTNLSDPDPDAECKVCQGSLEHYTVDNQSGTQYDWYVDEGDHYMLAQSSSLSTFDHAFETPGTHYVKVIMSKGGDCPLVLTDVRVIEVVANPDPVISASDFLDCVNYTPLTLNASIYPFATSESFAWWHDGNQIENPFDLPVYEVVPTNDGPQLVISGTSNSDYEGNYHVVVTRVIDNLTCQADADLTLVCGPGFNEGGPGTGVVFEDWEFDLGILNAECGTTGMEMGANECGHIRVKGDLKGREFSEVEAAAWVVFDPSHSLVNNLTPPNIFPIVTFDDLVHGEISTFTHVGYYPTSLNVKFFGDDLIYFDTRMLQIPMVPNLQATYACGSTPGTYELTLRDISELLPGVTIDNRVWSVIINGTAQVLSSSDDVVTVTVPAGMNITVSLTPYTHTIGSDKPGMEYHCTFCLNLDLPPVPTASIEALPSNTVCFGTPIQFISHVLPNTDDVLGYHWDFGDFSTTGIANPIKNYPFPGDFMVTLTVSTEFGCDVEATQDVHINISNLNGNITVVKDDCETSATLAYQPLPGSNTPTSWLWSNGSTNPTITVTSGIYDVTVSDGICEYSPTAANIDLIDLFAGGIQGDLQVCTGDWILLNISSNTGFTYVWTSDLPGFPKTGASIQVFNAPYQSTPYTVTVTAYKNGVTCTSVTAEVIVNPLPPAPTFDVDYTCEPFTAHIATNPSNPVTWFYQGNYAAFGPAITVDEGGFYSATIVNQYGCSASSNINITDPISVDILSGCYTLCDTLLEEGGICLDGPPGSFTSWQWVLLPNTPLSAPGSGPVAPLCLTTAMEGEIVLQVRQQYQNSNPPPGSTLTCTAQSEPFCLEVIECDKCPYKHIDGYFDLQCMLDAEEQVFSLHSALTIPNGWHYCGIEPEINGGFILYNPGLPSYNSYTHELQIDGFLHVNPASDYLANNGLTGTLIICNDLTGEQCTVKFVIPYKECTETFWCMMDVEEVVNNQELSPENWTVTFNFSFPGHYITNPCSLTTYTAYLGVPNGFGGFSQLFLGPVQFNATPPAFQMNTLSWTIPYARYLQGGCFMLRYLAACSGNEGSFGFICNLNYCYGEGGWGGIGKGRNDEETSDADYLAINPNPASETVQVAYALEGRGRIQLRNGLGQIVRDIDLDEKESIISIDVSDLSPGIYLATLLQNGAALETKKLVITR